MNGAKVLVFSLALTAMPKKKRDNPTFRSAIDNRHSYGPHVDGSYFGLVLFSDLRCVKNNNWQLTACWTRQCQCRNSLLSACQRLSARLFDRNRQYRVQ